MGRISEVQNITASRWFTFSGSQPSFRRSKILRLSLIFATLDTSISNSLFSVRSRFARSSSHCPSRGLALRSSQHLPTSRCLEPHLAATHLHLQQHAYSGVAGTCTARARGIYWSVGEPELDSLGGPFAGRVPCVAFSLFQSLLALRCSLTQFFHSCAAYC